ncbi:MAG: NblA/ycf18 family protein [Cyanobacteria bacterium P01_A01_bin.45]
MDIPSGLSMEQQFRLQTLKQQVETLSKEQAQAYLLEVLRQMMVKDNLVKNLLKNSEKF